LLLLLLSLLWLLLLVIVVVGEVCRHETSEGLDRFGQFSVGIDLD